MSAPVVAALSVAGVCAIGDWWARARRLSLVEYLCKPATMAGLLAAAALLHPAGGLAARQDWFVGALALSLLGDVLLMVPGDRFVAGLTAFLLAHLCYIVGFFLPGPSGPGLVLCAVVVVLLTAPVARHILRALRSHRRLRGPVAAYVTVICVMVATALASGNPLAGAGAVLFAVSDSMIAWDRFVRPLRAAPVAIMVTYHLGQAGLVLSLLH
jgi:uncharacterized membrane protein YhhN